MAEIHEVHRFVKGGQVRDLTKEASSGPEGSMDEIEELQNSVLGHMFEHIDGGDESQIDRPSCPGTPCLRSIRHFSRPSVRATSNC